MQTLSLAELENFDSRSANRGKERRFLCPLCGLNKPKDAVHRALVVNTENGAFICHRCQIKGKLQEYWETRPIIQKKQKTRLKLISHFSIRESEIAKKELKPTENLVEKMQNFQLNFLHSPAEIYLLNRGITTDIATKAGCGYAENWNHWVKDNENWKLKGCDKRVVFPIHDEISNLIAYHGRAIDSNSIDSTKITRGDKSQGLFLSDANVLNNKIVAICEGAIDAMSLACCGIPSVAMTGTTAPDWFYKKMAFKNVLIATDADEAGDKSAYKLKLELQSRGTKTLRLRPKNTKDWGEVLEKLGADEMQKNMFGFTENISDDARYLEALRLFKSGRKEVAEFVAGLITDLSLRETLLVEIRLNQIINKSDFSFRNFQTTQLGI